MQCVGVEIVTACRACGAAVAINGIVANAACPKCAKSVLLGADFWRQVFSAAVVQVARRSVGYEITTSFAASREEGDGQNIRLVLRRVNMPAGIAKREIPPGLIAEGIAFVAGEDLVSMRTDQGPNVVMMHCPACGAPLEIARGSTELACVYCGNTSLIAGEERAVGRPVKRFHLACKVSEAAATTERWDRVDAVAIDAADRVYVIGGGALFALDETLEGLRWMKSGIEPASGAQLVARDDRLVIVRKNDTPGECIRCSDGESLGAFAFAGPSRIRSVAPFHDGSWLVAVNGQPWGGQSAYTIFDRCTDDGTRIPTWGGDMAAAPDLGTPIPKLETRNAQPMVLKERIDVVAGWGGTMLFTDGNWLGRVTAFGAIDILLEHPRGVSWSYQLVALDGLGRIHALTHSDTGSGRYIVFDARGELAMKVERNTGTLGRERRIAAGPRGSVVLVGDRGRLRMLRPDGTLAYVSAGSAEDDRGA